MGKGALQPVKVRKKGQVRRRRVAAGSKSERDAVVLDTEDRSYLLRREGGNPFQDPELERLVGKQIDAEGIEHGQTLVLSGWEEL